MMVKSQHYFLWLPDPYVSNWEFSTKCWRLVQPKRLPDLAEILICGRLYKLLSLRSAEVKEGRRISLLSPILGT